MQPSIGRIVHYVSYGTPPNPDGSQAHLSRCRAAIITEVNGDPSVSVGLCVLSPSGLFLNPSIPYHEAKPATGGTWHWPERVPE